MRDVRTHAPTHGSGPPRRADELLTCRGSDDSSQVPQDGHLLQRWRRIDGCAKEYGSDNFPVARARVLFFCVGGYDLCLRLRYKSTTTELSVCVRLRQNLSTHTCFCRSRCESRTLLLNSFLYLTSAINCCFAMAKDTLCFSSS